MADFALLWMTLVLLFIRYPYKNGLCALFVLCSVCFIPTFALPESQIANLDFSKLEKHTTKNRAIQASPEVRDVTDSQTFRGFFATVGTVKEVEGRVHWIQGECGLDDDRGFARLPHDWIGILYYGKDKSDASNTSSECPQVLDRVKNALMFGASAIIILTLHPQIVRELDIAQLFAQPVVVVDEAKNVTAVLSIINKAKLKVKLMFGSVQRHILHVPKLTMWSACGRSAGKGDEVVCFDQGYTGKKGKVDPSTFWSCYYLIVFLLMLSFVMKARMRNGEWGPADQELEASLRQLAFRALDMMQTHKYRKLMDRGQDTCAICLDQFYPKQKLRVLPCQHHFHTRCVDPWLVDNRTCPLCKLNIIERLNEDD